MSRPTFDGLGRSVGVQRRQRGCYSRAALSRPRARVSAGVSPLVLGGGPGLLLEWARISAVRLLARAGRRDAPSWEVASYLARRRGRACPCCCAAPNDSPKRPGPQCARRQPARARCDGDAALAERANDLVHLPLVRRYRARRCRQRYAAAIRRCCARVRPSRSAPRRPRLSLAASGAGAWSASSAVSGQRCPRAPAARSARRRRSRDAAHGHHRRADEESGRDLADLAELIRLPNSNGPVIPPSPCPRRRRTRSRAPAFPSGRFRSPSDRPHWRRPRRGRTWRPRSAMNDHLSSVPPSRGRRGPPHRG